MPSHPQARPGPVVAIGASAGGIPALKVLLAALPGDFGAPVLLVLHLAPGLPTRLAEVLALHSALPVSMAAGGERPRPAHVYVAPPDTHLTVGRAGELALTHSAPELHVRPSADVLFASAAEHFGRDTVVLVLSGLGRDGSRGAREVHRRGGTVLVQDPASAEHGAMPAAAIATGCADRVVRLERIAPLLVELIHPPTSP